MGFVRLNRVLLLSNSRDSREPARMRRYRLFRTERMLNHKNREAGLRTPIGKEEVAPLTVRVPESAMAKAQSLCNRYDEGGVTL